MEIFEHLPRVVENCNLYKQNTIVLDRPWFTKGAILKFYKFNGKTIHKIMIEKKIKSENDITQYQFTNIFPIFSDTIILTGTEVKHVN